MLGLQEGKLVFQVTSNYTNLKIVSQYHYNNGEWVKVEALSDGQRGKNLMAMHQALCLQDQSIPHSGSKFEPE